MKFGVPLHLSELIPVDIVCQIDTIFEDAIFTFGRHPAMFNEQIMIYLTCDAENITKAQVLLKIKIEKIEFLLSLYGTFQNFKISAHDSQVKEITSILKMDFTAIREILPKITVGETERSIQRSIDGLKRKSEHMLYLNSFGDIVSTLDKLKGKNLTQLCSLRNLVKHQGEYPDKFATSLRKSQELELDLETDEGILIPNDHNVQEFSKKEDQLILEIKNYYKEMYSN